MRACVRVFPLKFFLFHFIFVVAVAVVAVVVIIVFVLGCLLSALFLCHIFLATFRRLVHKLAHSVWTICMRFVCHFSLKLFPERDPRISLSFHFM